MLYFSTPPSHASLTSRALGSNFIDLFDGLIADDADGAKGNPPLVAAPGTEFRIDDKETKMKTLERRVKTPSSETQSTAGSARLDRARSKSKSRPSSPSSESRRSRFSSKERKSKFKRDNGDFTILNL